MNKYVLMIFLVVCTMVACGGGEPVVANGNQNPAGDGDGDHDAGEPDGDRDTDTGGDADAGGDSDIGDGEPGDSDDFFEIHCDAPQDGWVTFDYEIGASTTSYMLVPFTSEWGGPINPWTITTPGGGIIDFQGENAFQLYGLEYEETHWLNPMVIPAVPQFDAQLESGLHTLLIASDEPEVCLYLIETEGSPTEIDFNFYLVGIDGLTSETAANHADFQSVLSYLDDIFEESNLSLGQIRYLEVPQEAVDSYQIIQSEWDVYDLIAYSQYPGQDRDSAISVNVFITRQFTADIVGLSMGIPGVVGWHDTFVSGIALTGEYIGVDEEHNQFTSVLIGHEVGHYLGLFHTSESTGEHDNLADTPECTTMNQPWDCPDAWNLMFPYIDFDTTEITADQRFVIEVNPLTK